MNFVHFVLKKQTIESSVFWGKKKLEQLASPKFETEFLLKNILNVELSFLRTNAEKKLTLLEKESFFRAIKKRANHIPSAYILEKKQWSGFEIKVNKNVLIPRDETEVLAKHVKNYLRTFVPTKILDIGTGSGCITVALAQHFKDSKFCALDISGMALKVAKKNVRTLVDNAERVSFWNSNLLDGILPNQSYQIIIANLPYVPTNITVTKEVKKEPYQAIFSGNDGLDLIRKLAHQILEKKIEFKELWLEFLPDSANGIQDIFKDFSVTFFNDVSEKPFFACISLKKTDQL